MKLNLLSGNIKIRKRSVPLLWTGEIAEHVSTNYNKDSSHNMLHVQIQQMASRSVFLKKKGSRYVGIYKLSSGHVFCCAVQLFTNFAKILTGYRLPFQNLNTATKQLIAGNGKPKKKVQQSRLVFEEWQVKELNRWGFTVEDAQQAWSLYLKTRKKK